MGSILAFEVGDSAGMAIVTAPRDREWMHATDQRFANRCLPLLLANQSGWFITNPVEFNVQWNGGNAKEDLRIEFPNDQYIDNRIKSHFGYGILTFNLPYLFRTPDGVNLLVRGPSNLFKDGVHPLEGIVETDWNCSTFTMNWKLTRPNLSVNFQKGEPICMIVPVHRGVLENFQPEIRALKAGEQLHEDYHKWRTRRNEFLAALSSEEPNAVREGWQRDYFKGINVGGDPFQGHQTHLVLQEFQRL